ncbi:MAG: hypothetical protein AB7O31_13480 [Burkholderiales bacterium]
MSADNGKPAAWAALAHRGRLSMRLLTRARAVQDGIATHAEAEYVIVLQPDGGNPVPVSCASIGHTLAFVRDMEPRAVAVEVAGFEDRAPLVALLERAGRTSH